MASLLFLPPPEAFRCRPSEFGGGEVTQLTLEGRPKCEPVPLRGVWLLEKAEGGWAGLGKLLEWDVRDYLIIERSLVHNSLGDPGSERWFYSVDFEASPNTIDSHTVDSAEPISEQGISKPTQQHGIFKIEGDRLTVCFCDVRSPRPTEFTSKGKACPLLRFRKMSDDRHGLRGVADELAEMMADPKRCLDDPTKSEAPDFLEMLGYAFALGGRDRLGRLTRTEAVAHLRHCLASADWMAVLQALTALERITALQRIGEAGGKEEVQLVIPLLRHPVQQVRLAAAEYLVRVPDSRAAGPLCQALDEVEKDGDLGNFIGWALCAYRNPEVVAALERAVRRGIRGGPEWALGELGGESAFETLLDGVEKRDSMFAVVGLRSLILRSNKKPEPWMDKSNWPLEFSWGARGSGQPLDENKNRGLKDKGKWRKWWDANKADFKIIKTADEAFGRRK